jgi:hypothetical protein
MTGKQSMEAFANQIGWPYSTFPEITHGAVLAGKWPKETLDAVEASYKDSNPHYFPYIPELNEYMDRVGTAASEAISGAGTVDSTLDNLQKWSVERMKKAGYY